MHPCDFSARSGCTDGYRWAPRLWCGFGPKISSGHAQYVVQKFGYKVQADVCDYVCAQRGVEQCGVGVTMVNDPQ
jgi:hypothetical protein